MECHSQEAHSSQGTKRKRRGTKMTTRAPNMKPYTNATYETSDAQTNNCNSSRKHAYIILTPLNPTFI